MPRRGKVEGRKIVPDIKYNSPVVAMFINKLMQRGQKATAERIVYTAMELAEKQLKKKPMEILEQSIKRVTPLLQVKPRRVAGATYQVPVELKPGQGLSLAMRWLIRASRARKGADMAHRLSIELIDAYQGQGAAVKRREDLHKMAEANRAFVHYRW